MPETKIETAHRNSKSFVPSRRKRSGPELLIRSFCAIDREDHLTQIVLTGTEVRTSKKEVSMANLVALMHLSFDGFAAGPNGEMNWIKHDGEVFEHASKFISKVGTGVYGPVTFQMMEGFWPSVLESTEADESEKQHAKWYQSAKKVVCSRTLKQLENKEAKLINANLEEEIKKLKQQPGKDLMVFGSPRLTQALARLDLFDEYVINVNPILLGGGVRMFEDLPRTKLNLVSATTFDGGVVGFHYKK
jgi:dihydrofolate reductase